MVQVEALGKRYRLRHNADGGVHRYTTLRDVLAASAAAPWQWLTGSRRDGTATGEDFWALRDVSFQVAEGEVVGIIGRNGAGKSTLLKILSRITEPTSGRVTLGGRVASLLEVGTGFHPELTGRENIYLNGAILGMSRQEMARKFDEIVAFAEVERFLDTPVKHYSSGMYVRLAFGVAAHLEPDVLIVDEVLAVGDAEFQKKSLGKMREVSRGGRTELFVSPNIAAVQSLCGRAIWLDRGAVAFDGAVGDSISRYLDHGPATPVAPDHAVQLGPALELRRFVFTPNPVMSGDAVRFTIEVFARETARVGELAVLLLSAQETRVAIVDLRNRLPVTLAPGQAFRISGAIDKLPLVEGDYRAGVYAVAGDFTGNLHDLADLRVVARASADGHAPYPAMYRGVVELGATIDATSSP